MSDVKFPDNADY